MASLGMSYEELQIRKKLLLDQLAETQNGITQNNSFQGSMDIHHPERSAGWPRYKHQEYPRMMHHPIKLDPAREMQRRGVEERNRINPQLAPLPIPAPRQLTKIVHSEVELEQAENEGFTRTPPELKAEAQIPAVASDPLSDPRFVHTDTETKKRK